jgi:hypothetical protein
MNEANSRLTDLFVTARPSSSVTVFPAKNDIPDENVI